jgi:hypothetical protein
MVRGEYYLLSFMEKEIVGVQVNNIKIFICFSTYYRTGNWGNKRAPTELIENDAFNISSLPLERLHQVGT